MYQDTGLCIFDWCRLRLNYNQNWLRILVCTLVDFQRILLYTSIPPDHYIRDIGCLVHMAMGYMGALQPVLKMEFKLYWLLLIWSSAHTQTFKLQTSIWLTRHKRISGHTRWTNTNWNMICNFAYCILSTYSWAWIDAFIFQTRLIVWTLLIDNTFRPTADIRIAVIFW